MQSKVRVGQRSVRCIRCTLARSAEARISSYVSVLKARCLRRFGSCLTSCAYACRASLALAVTGMVAYEFTETFEDSSCGRGKLRCT